MRKVQYSQIMESLEKWAIREGLCRFCDAGRRCPCSRRGVEICPTNKYRFTAERICFHQWIKRAYTEFFDFKPGYENLDDHPSFHPELEDRFPDQSFLFNSDLDNIGSNCKISKQILNEQFYNFLLNLDNGNIFPIIRDLYFHFVKPFEGLMFIEALAFLRNGGYISIYERKNLLEVNHARKHDLMASIDKYLTRK